MGFQDPWWNISTSGMVILAASVFAISCGKTAKQTNIHTYIHTYTPLTNYYSEDICYATKYFYNRLQTTTDKLGL